MLTDEFSPEEVAEIDEVLGGKQAKAAAKKSSKSKKAEEAKTIEIKPVYFETVEILLKGNTGLLVHNWSAKAKREMLEAQQMTASEKAAKKKKRPLRVPYQEFLGSLYFLTHAPDTDWDDVYDSKGIQEATDAAVASFEKAVADGARFGFPASAIKKCAAMQAYRLGQINSSRDFYTSCTIFGSPLDPTRLNVEILSPEPPVPFEAPVKLMGKTSDLRYRGMFTNWEIPILVRYIKDGPFSLGQLVTMIHAGGQCAGIGEWRNERGGSLGLYEVEGYQNYQNSEEKSKEDAAKKAATKEFFDKLK